MTTAAAFSTRSDDRTAPTRLARALVVAGATVGGVMVWTVSGPLAGTELQVGSGASQRTIGVVAVILTGLVAGAAGAAVAALLERRARQARGIWFALASAVLALSLVGPLGATTGRAVLTLAAMHLAVGVTLIVGLGRSIRTDRRS